MIAAPAGAAVLLLATYMRRLLWAILIPILVPGVAATNMWAERRDRGHSTVIQTFLDDIRGVEGHSGASAGAVTVLAALIGGLRESGLITSTYYDAARRRADFRIRGGGAVGNVPPDALVWFSFVVKARLRILWKVTSGGALELRFIGLRMRPLPHASEFYVRSGLDEWACPRQDLASRKEYYTCHLKKAQLLEALWDNDRERFPKNLAWLFGTLAKRELIMQVAKKLGNGFGWGMLLFVSAPPSCLDTLTFDSNGLVAATTSLDRSADGWRLAMRHRYKDLALDIARPLLGDTHFGSLVRAVGERWLRVATNFAVVLSVGEPRWRGRGIRGADPGAIADVFTIRHKISGTGTIEWRRYREKQDTRRGRGGEGGEAGEDAAFSLLLLPEPRRALPPECSSSELQARWLPPPPASAPHGLLTVAPTAPRQAELGLAAVSRAAVAGLAIVFVLRSSSLGVGPARRRHQHAR